MTDPIIHMRQMDLRSVDGDRITGTYPAPGDARPAGILVDGVDGGRIRDVGIDGCAFGILTGKTCRNLLVDGVQITNTTGQHGVYLGHVVGAMFRGVHIANTHLQGFKVQVAKDTPADSEAIVIEDLTVMGAGSHALLITATKGSERRILDVVVRRATLHTREPGASGLCIIGPHRVWLEDVRIFGRGLDRPVRVEGGAEVHGQESIRLYQ